MRKLIVLLLLLLVCAAALVYLLVPTTVVVKKTTRIAVNANAFTRVLLHEGRDHEWLAGNKDSDTSNNCFTYNQKTYTLLEKKISSLVYAIGDGQDSMLAELVVIPFQPDSVELNFVGVAKTGFNPLTRIQHYAWAKQTADDLLSLLQQIHDYYADNIRVYGFHVERAFISDSLLVSASAKLKAPPTTDLVYSLLDKLKAYVAKKEARVTGLPMLNVTANADSTYLTRVALPVNRRIGNEDGIEFRWMMGGGNILITDVKGGPTQIEKAFSATRAYVRDHSFATAAIPFESLVTDRRTEPDTNKWITKVNWPVR